MSVPDARLAALLSLLTARGLVPAKSETAGRIRVEVEVDASHPVEFWTDFLRLVESADAAGSHGSAIHSQQIWVIFQTSDPQAAGSAEGPPDQP